MIADTEGYLDINEVLNTALNILNGEEVGVDVTLTGAALADVLVNAGVADLGSSVDNLVLAISGDVNVKALTASASVKVTDGEKVLLDANVYYDYNAGANGTAYIKVTNVLGAACEVKVYGEIDKTVENVKALITAIQGAIPETLAEEGDSTTNVADIVAKILAIDFGGIVTDLKVNASGLATTINADNLISQFADINLGIGEVRLSYADGKLTGDALSGGLEITAGKGEVVKDTEGYLDINEVLNTALNILNGEEVGVDITLTGAALADVLVNAGVADLGSSVDNLVLAISGDVNVKALTASASVKVTDENNYSYLDADIYYEYAAGTYGKVYVALNALLGKDLNGSVKVYCDINSAAEQITQLISVINGTNGASSLDVNQPSDEENTVQAIIKTVLGLDFCDMVKELAMNAEGFKATVDLGRILSLAGVDLELGEVTLLYNFASDMLTGSALNGGLELKAHSGKAISVPEGEYLDVAELLNSVNMLLSDNVGVNITLTGEALEKFLKNNNLVDLNGLLDGAALSISGSADISTLKARAQVELYEQGGEEEYYYLDAEIYYDYSQGEYGTAYINIRQLFGEKCEIKVKSNIADTVTSVEKLIAAINAASVKAASETEADPALDSVTEIISGVLAMRLDLVILSMQSGVDGFTVELDADALVGEILKLVNSGASVPVTFGNVTLAYSIENNTLSGSALDGGLQITVNKGGEIGEAPLGCTDIVTVIELITKATDIAGSIAEKRAVAFDIDAIITANGVSFRLFGKGEIMWNEAGVVTVVALDVQLSLYCGAADETPMDLEFIYNGTAVDDKPFIRLAINNAVLNITRGDIKSAEEQINTIVAAVNKIFGNGSTDVKALEELAKEAGMTTVSGVPSTSGTSVTVVDSQLIKALVGALGGEGLAGELFTTLLSGSSVTVDELGNYINVLFKDGADITLGVDGGKLTLCGEVKADGLFAADIKASASAEVKDLAGTLAEAFDAEGGKYVQYSVSEGNPLIKIVYYYILDSFDGLDIGSFLGGKSYKVDLVLAGNISKVEALAGVNVKAELYFTDGIEYGQKASGKLVETNFDISAGSFSMKAGAVYIGRNLYVSITQINGTQLSGLNVYVSADNIYRAVENIIALVSDEKVINFFGGLMGNGGSGASGASTLSEEEKQSVTDLLVTLITLDYKQYITIIPDGGRTTITADIGGILDAFGIDQSAAGKATITADGDGGLDIDVYSKLSEGEAQPEYGWLRLDAVKTEKRAYDSAAYSSYINIGFVADLIDDAHKIISANTDPSTGEVSSLFTLEGGTITVNIDLSKVGVSSTLASLNQISITDINFVVGLDSNREIYFSLEGYLNDVNAKIVGITSNIASGHKIGITYSNGYITLARFDGTSREYWVMTLEYFIDNLFSSYEGNADSPLRWLCDIDKTILGINVWNDILVANLADIASGISSGITEPDNIYLYELFNNDSAFDSGNSASAMPSIIADYIIGFVSNVGTTCELGYYDSALTNLGLDSATMKYYAASLNAGQLTGGTLDALDVALIHSDDYGIGGLKAYASLQSRLVQISFNISYNGLDDNTADVENNYESALSIAGTNEDGTSKIDFYHSEPVYAGSGDNEIHYADEVFGGAKVSNNGDVVNTYQTKYIDEAITITVYQSKDDMLAGVNGKKIGVKYNSSIYMHSASNIMVSENGKINIYVMADENGEPVASNGEYPESVKVTSPNTNFYLMEVEYKAAKVTVHNILDGSAVTLNVYSGTSLDEIAKATFGDYSVRGGKWYTDADKLVAFEGTSITVPEEHEGTLYTVDLYAEFIQTNVTINGVIYTFVDGEEPHYEITGHTSSLSVYYAENSVLVLENEIDGYPVTRINANALKNDDSSLERGLQNVIVPENITYVGSNAFTDNYGIKSVIFFADSVTLEGSVSEKTYPFYGCSTVSDGTSSDLKVYFNTINGSTTVGEDWNHFRTSGSTIFDKKYYYFAAYGAGTWAFINYNITLDGETYNDQFGELTADLPSAGMLLTSVNDSFDTAEEIEDYVLNIIDEYTLEHNLCIGMYNVSVDRGVELNGYYTVNITVASTDEEWYPIQIVNVRTEGYGNGTISFGEGQYKQFKGRTYLKAGSSVTVTAVPDGESEFVSAEFGKNVYFDNPFTFVMPEEFSEITIVWQQKAEKFITVYSEVSFTYNGNSFGGSENNEYLLYESVVGEGQNTLGASVAVDAGYYFLGWAVSNGDALEFVTATVDYEKEGISYYAIWAYNGSQTLTVNNVTNSSSSLPADIAAAQGSFYAWYTSRTENPETEVVAFEGQTETLVGLNTIYYARLQFTLDFTLDGNGDTRFYVNGSQDYYTRQDCSTKDSVLLEAMGGELVVYEGGSVKVTPSNSSTQLNIYLYESIEEAEPYRVVSVTGKGKGTWGQWNKNRTFFNNSDKAASFNGFTEKTSHKYIADNAVWIQAINISGNIDFTLEY